MIWQEIVFLILATIGVLTLLVSAYGMISLAGVHQRMQAASVGSTVGIAVLLIGAGIYFISEAELARMIVLILFFFLTAPIATTAIARAAYRRPIELTSERFSHDDMANPSYTQDSLEATQTIAGDPKAPPTPAPTPNPAPDA
jgi:multicomponent Na+:H+ antiporter subunit G